MSRKCLITLAALAWLAPAALFAQVPAADRPVPHVAKTPLTRQDLDHREAQKLFGLAAFHERHNRLVEALHTYDEARRLEPDAVPIHRALVPIFLALDRADEALATCKRILDLDPADAEIAFLLARQLRAGNNTKEALAVLTRAAALPGLKDQPDLHAQIDFERGTLYEAAGEWAKAEAAFQGVAEILDHPAGLLEAKPYSRADIDTQAAETFERLGRVRLRAGKPELAVEAFRKAQKKDATRAARLAFNLAEVLRDQSKLQEALASLNEYLRTKPVATDGYELKTTLLRQLGRGTDVVPELETAAGGDPSNSGLKLLLAREYRRARERNKAKTIYEKLRDENPTPEVYRELFALYKEDRQKGGDDVLGLLDEAVKKAVKKDEQPGDSTAAANARAMLVVLRDDAELVGRLLDAAHRRLLGGRSLEFQTRVLLAGLASRTRQLDAAEELYRSCLNRPGGLRDMEQEVYGGLLRVLLQAHKYDAVVAVCKQGLEKAQATNRVLFHLDLAHGLMGLHRPKEALEAADAAVNDAGDKDRLVCRRVRIEILSQSGKHEQAVAECQTLFKEYNQPGEVRDIRATLSSVHSAARNHAKAEEQLQLLLRDDPNDATANNDLGYLWADQNKNLDEAERMIRKALELDRQQRSSGTAVGLDADRDNAAYVDSLGWLLFRKGDLAGARRELEKAAGLAGGAEDPVVWDHLGDVYFRQGVADKAAANWKKAVELYDAGRRRPDERYKEIQQKVRRLAP